jgi:catechol 2,3-dioxygenase-like lactoylglutathione lyase family enzyme
MSTMFATIDHVAIPVDNIRKTIEWYEAHFDCRVLYEDATWAYLQFANIKLALVVKDEHPPHIAFAVKDAKRFGELKKHRDNTESCYVKDNNGNAVELVEAASIIHH